MTAADEMRNVEERRGSDPLRRVILGALALYLAPVALVILLIGGVGMASVAVLGLVRGGVRYAQGAGRFEGPMRVLPAPHLRGVVWSRSSRH